jgi:CRISPR-associated protein Csb2
VNDVQTVSEPIKARQKLLEAEDAAAAARAEGDQKALKKAERGLERARSKVEADSMKASDPSKALSKADFSATAAVLPDSRTRQPRTFPACVPAEPLVTFVWPEAPTPALRAALISLCERLVRLGHSSSLVRAWLREPASPDELRPEPALTPHPEGPEVLRVPEPGQLERLAAAFEVHQGVELRILPTGFQRYGDVATAMEPPARSVFADDFIVFERVGGDPLTLVRAADLGEALRGALMAHADQPVPEVLSGHRSNGQPVEHPHAAFVALPHVGSTYAEGQVLGVAVVPPRGDAEGRRQLARAIGRWEASASGTAEAPSDDAPELKLALGRPGVLHVQRVAFGEASRQTLRRATWTGPSRFWATATPIALDRNPGDLHAASAERRRRAFEEAEATVARACAHVGLPPPTYVEVTRSATMTGTAKPRAHPPFPRASNKPRRVLVHARIEFANPVRGPVLLGAGRYLGLGLCRPIPPRQEKEPT